MQSNEKLELGHYYHIYSHGVGGRDLFRCEENYLHFLSLYDKYIDPVAETYAWVLMPNHFHVVVRIKEKEAIPLLITPNFVPYGIKLDLRYLCSFTCCFIMFILKRSCKSGMKGGRSPTGSTLLQDRCHIYLVFCLTISSSYDK